ncbi:P27 family phage terminase small subunit [Agrobacterium tumefaciens]|uniref:P27 family phage terminase small subunit n=1 Tax=Agrobacterium tumefaciens TaxID=358 RepID=UPI0021D30FDF|nr:P27 family phage terminase small subunit [Agrobacterium tumefaciens]UXT48173.1 P27 family phage terminase small subunit [Agrobacterium tumefaciens]
MTHLRGVKPTVERDSNALTKAPSAPKHLSAYARAEWKRIMPGLIERGIITRGDLGGIEDLCMARGFAREVEDARRAAPMDKVLFGMQNRALQTARQLAAEYGLSPTSRARVGSAAAEDDDEPNAMMIGRNRAHA